MRYLLILGFSSLLSSCAYDSNIYFAGPGSKADLLAARYQCFQENQAYVGSGGAVVYGAYGGASQGFTKTCSMSGFRSCLSAKGYTQTAPAYANFTVSAYEKVYCAAP